MRETGPETHYKVSQSISQLILLECLQVLRLV